MIEQADNDSVRGSGCVQCGHVDTPINVGPGPGWLAAGLWGAAAALWLINMLVPALWPGHLAAAVLLAAFIYTLWYFYRREKACRHCGARWVGSSADPSAGPAPDRHDPIDG